MRVCRKRTAFLVLGVYFVVAPRSGAPQESVFAQDGLGIIFQDVAQRSYVVFIAGAAPDKTIRNLRLAFRKPLAVCPYKIAVARYLYASCYFRNIEFGVILYWAPHGRVERICEILFIKRNTS